MQINPGDLSHGENYKLLTSVVVPRAIAWVSSRSAAGVNNLAPFSFFTVATPTPPTVLFSIGKSSPESTRVKDTLRNARETGEFVINVVSEALAGPMNITGADFPPEVDEFTAAGLTPVPARLVAAPRVGESLVHLECKFVREVEVGVSTLVFGEILVYEIDDSVLTGKYVDPLKLLPLARLGGPQYSTVRELLHMPRIMTPPGEAR